MKDNKGNEVLSGYSKAIQRGVNCLKTGTIEKVKDKTVDVKLENGDILADVPLFNFGISSSLGIFFPIEKGVKGSLFIFDSDISGFLTGAKQAKEEHIHRLEDCFFFPGFLPNAARPEFQENLLVKNGNMSIEMSDGKIKIQGGAKEILSLITTYMANATSILDLIINDKLAVAGATASHTVAVTGPWGLTVKSAMDNAKSDIEDITL